MNKKPKQQKNVKKTTVLSLSRDELVLLRDLMSIRLPPTFEDTISSVIATKQNKSLQETTLWEKIVEACSVLNIGVGELAPDFAIVLAGLPALDIVEIASQQDSEAQKSNNIFEGK